ncbi:ABC transporter ATP-binding protein [Propionibacteriaceae bacterium Y1923]|uniref:ABC transporter ATP-binding protein n=1 Tax=Aestuariimicrobium sp. Y1814 TaxID=3418742 RepID=UPI003C251156
MSPALEVVGLDKSFDGVHAVNNVSFSIEPGQTLAIIGPNGSGKTTTLNLVTGTLKPDAGQVRLAGRDIAGHSPEEVAEHGLTRTFQNGRVFATLTVADNIEVGLHSRLSAQRPFKKLAHLPVLRWLPLLAEVAVALVTTPGVKAEREQVATRVDNQVGRFRERLGPRVEHRTHTLSYANRRRTEIARALVSDPDVLVLDEPTAGMNQSETAEVLQQLLDLKASGQTILLVEHKLDLVMTLSDQVIVMDEGRLIAAGRPEDVRHDPRVISAYLGRRHQAEEPDEVLVVHDPLEVAEPTEQEQTHD